MLSTWAVSHTTHHLMDYGTFASLMAFLDSQQEQAVLLYIMLLVEAACIVVRYAFIRRISFSNWDTIVLMQLGGCNCRFLLQGEPVELL